MDFLHLGGIFGNSGKLPGKLPGNLPGKRFGNLHVLPALRRNLRTFPDFIKFNTIFEIFIVFDSWPPGVVVHAGYCAHSYVTQQCALHVCGCVWLECYVLYWIDVMHIFEYNQDITKSFATLKIPYVADTATATVTDTAATIIDYNISEWNAIII